MEEPGQFVHIKVSDSTGALLRRPISIEQNRSCKKEFTMIYQEEGRGTTIFSEKKLADQWTC